MGCRGSRLPLYLEASESLLFRKRERERKTERFHFQRLFPDPDLLTFCIIMTVMQEYLGINNELCVVHSLNSEMEPSDLHTGWESLKTSGHPSQVFLCWLLLNWIWSFYFIAISTDRGQNRAWNSSLLLFIYFFSSERRCLTIKIFRRST